MSADKIARAYGVLAARGEKITVRAVQREAGVRIGEVATWLREHVPSASEEVPEAPDLSEAIEAMSQTVWAVAWLRAAEQAEQSVADSLDAAREGEAAALAAAEQASAERDAAVTERDRIVAEADRLRHDLAQAQRELESAHRESQQAMSLAEESDRARVRAEATSDTLREVLDTFRRSGAGTAAESGPK